MRTSQEPESHGFSHHECSYRCKAIRFQRSLEDDDPLWVGFSFLLTAAFVGGVGWLIVYTMQEYPDVWMVFGMATAALVAITAGFVAVCYVAGSAVKMWLPSVVMRLLAWYEHLRGGEDE